MTYLQETHTVHRGRGYVGTQLNRIANKSAQNKNQAFTSLYHLLNEEMLKRCFAEVDRYKAYGIDRVTKDEYETNLNENIEILVEKLKTNQYKPQPAKRTYIPKGNRDFRPLGIPCFEDKLVQLGLSKILEAIYEPNFLDSSYGFRPKRSCHHALRKLNTVIRYKPINHIVDADIKGFFNNVDHNWVIEFIKHRIKDPNIIKLIKKMLNAGIIEDDKFVFTTKGMPQGSIVSPILSNIYLHYVLDLWFEYRVKHVSDGACEIIRYADDFVCCFKYQGDSRRFLKSLKERMNKFGLELAENKTKTIAFGKYANEKLPHRRNKPETFDFLGFTHYCKIARNGYFTVEVKTSAKKYKDKLKGLKMWFKKAVYVADTKVLIDKLNRILRGYYNYYCVAGNSKMVARFREDVIQLMFKWLNRRSQRRSYTWGNFNKVLKKHPIIRPRVMTTFRDDLLCE
ncbi:group II intron reverse transcriptase/maturase [Virgibacillus sp. W0181]|uniref:group II intron reverse transcriptase/maturase n=1 Tax=Virgibacillus sp. W0181 TaxID=3391581 RepID=UPI003F475D2E